MKNIEKNNENITCGGHVARSLLKDWAVMRHNDELEEQRYLNTLEKLAVKQLNQPTPDIRRKIGVDFATNKPKYTIWPTYQQKEEEKYLERNIELLENLFEGARDTKEGCYNLGGAQLEKVGFIYDWEKLVKS